MEKEDAEQVSEEERKDEKTGLVFQLKIKKVAAYHQYYAILDVFASIPSAIMQRAL
jgi:hypothetical protein